MMDSLSLLYLSSDYIVEYSRKHPTYWYYNDRHLARRRGIADQAGMPPVTNAEIFLSHMHEINGLMTQEEHFDRCVECWERKQPGWFHGKGRGLQYALRVKTFRNFHPSFVDSLHVWALLSETGLFDRCLWNSTKDVTKGSDLTVWRGDKSAVLALLAYTSNGISDFHYKQNHRNGNKEAFPVVLTKRTRGAGGKMWYTLDDLAEFLDLFCETI